MTRVRTISDNDPPSACKAFAITSRAATVWLLAEVPPSTGIVDIWELAVVPDTRIVSPVRMARQ